MLTRGEICTVKFDILNNTDKPVSNITPLVAEISRNKHINVSPNLRIESIAPFRGVRYSATIKADDRLKDGEIVITMGVAENNREIESQTHEYHIKTSKKK